MVNVAFGYVMNSNMKEIEIENDLCITVKKFYLLNKSITYLQIDSKQNRIIDIL